MHLYVKVVFQVFNTFQGPGPLPTPSSPPRRLITHCHKALFSSEGSGAPEAPQGQHPLVGCWIKSLGKSWGKKTTFSEKNWWARFWNQKNSMFFCASVGVDWSWNCLINSDLSGCSFTAHPKSFHIIFRRWRGSLRFMISWCKREFLVNSHAKDMKNLAKDRPWRKLTADP